MKFIIMHEIGPSDGKILVIDILIIDIVSQSRLNAIEKS